MQVSNLDTVPTTGNEKDIAKPAFTGSDAFAILLQNTFEPETNPALLRLADGSELAQQISEGRDLLAEVRADDNNSIDDSVPFDDPTAVPTTENVAEDRREDDEPGPVKPADPYPLVSDSRLSPNGVNAAIAAVSGQNSDTQQQRGAAQRGLAEAPDVKSAATKDAAAGSAGTAASKNSGGEGRIPASVTDANQQLVSRPANTLAAAASLAAQTSKAGGGAEFGGNSNTANGNTATGNLLLSDAGGRTSQQGGGNHGQNAQRGPTQYVQTAANNPIDASSNTPNTQASFQAALNGSRGNANAAAARPMTGAERGSTLLPIEPTALGSPSTTANGAGRTGTPSPAPRPPVPPGALREQIAVQVQRAVGQGVDRINIQLKPADLGRLEIKLDVAQDGRVTAVVTVERPDTLELLQRDSRGLQQALQDAGLKTDSNGLNFNLRGGDTAPQQQTADGGGAVDQNGTDATSSDELAENQDESTRRPANDSLVDVEV